MRKIGPSAPPAGLAQDIEQAEHDKLSTEALANLLTGHRGGDPGAAKRLTQALRHLAYDFYGRVPWSPRRSAEDVLGTLFVELGTAIERLGRNDVTAEDVPGFVVGHLQHSIDHYGAEVAEAIFPPGATNASRIASGKEPYVALRRRPEGRPNHAGPTAGDDVGGDSLLDAPPPAPAASQDGTPYRNPYSDDPSALDRLEYAAETAEEREYVEGLRQGDTQGKIARRLGRQRVNAIRKRLARRVSKEARGQW